MIVDNYGTPWDTSLIWPEMAYIPVGKKGIVVYLPKAVLTEVFGHGLRLTTGGLSGNRVHIRPTKGERRMVMSLGQWMLGWIAELLGYQLTEKDEGDHTNLNPSDNHPQNIRPLNDQQQMCNQALRKNNKTGFKGVKTREYGFQASHHLRDGGSWSLRGNDPIKLAAAYDTVHRVECGEAGRYNFPIGDERSARFSDPIPEYLRMEGRQGLEVFRHEAVAL
jgi:hypothetical protein